MLGYLRLRSPLFSPEEEKGSGGVATPDPAPKDKEEAPAPPADSGRLVPGAEDTQENWDAPNPLLDGKSPREEPADIPDLKIVPPSEDDEEVPQNSGKDQEDPGKEKFSRKTMRDELDSRKVEIADLQTRLEAAEKAKTEAEETLKANLEKLKETESSYVETRSVKPYSPQEDEDLKPITKRLVRTMNSAKSDFESTESATLFEANIDSLLTSLIEYQDKGQPLGPFKESLEENFGGDAENVEKALKDMAEDYRSRAEMMQANSNQWGEKVSKRHEDDYRKTLDRFSKLGAKTTEEMKEDPNGLDTILTQIAASDDKFSAKLEKLRRDGARVQAGLPPLKAGATEEEITAYRAEEAKIAQAREHAVYGMIQAEAMESLFVSVYGELRKLRSRVKDGADANRAGSEYESEEEPKRKLSPNGAPLVEDREGYEQVQNPHL